MWKRMAFLRNDNGLSLSQLQQPALYQKLSFPLPRLTTFADSVHGNLASPGPVRNAGHWSLAAATAQQSETSGPAHEGTDAESVTHSEAEHSAKVAEESLGLLEWPAVCRQVAAFASVSLTASNIVRNGLTVGRTQVCFAAVSVFQHYFDCFSWPAGTADNFAMQYSSLKRTCFRRRARSC